MACICPGYNLETCFLGFKFPYRQMLAKKDDHNTTHTLEKVAPWSVISGCFAVCISPLHLGTALAESISTLLQKQRMRQR